ncbi:uncharacterized protein LOC130718628 [Lotus japonicus]|uniref:uncharacterized protein LOC130718628 n=1 Tax=Lotus japonicus TaxID=34305 RepID=UPI002587E2A5|nr:uncharacterized protein LOC130718628 [Lotus japonicus]
MSIPPPLQVALTSLHSVEVQTKEKRKRIMGTREVYEQKLKTGNLDHDPTLNPGLGSARCPRCLSLLNPNPERGEWTINSVLHDATAVAGSGIGSMLSAVHGLNTGLPYLQNRLKGPKWLPFVVGLPPLLIFSGASAAFGGYMLPKFTQLTVTSYYAASSASHYGISLLTRHIEDKSNSETQHLKRL